MVQRTLSIIKPHAIKDGLRGAINSRTEANEFKIVAQKMVWLTKKVAEGFYEHLEGQPFYDKVTSNMSFGPCVVMVLEKENAIDDWREMIGHTDPKKAAYGTIRREFGTSIDYNAVHGSDSEESAEKEINFFFKEEEIFSF